MQDIPQDGAQNTSGELAKERELRKAAEARNAEYRFFLQSLIDSLPDILFVKDKRGAYVACNQACARIWGLKTSQVVGCTDKELSAHNDAEFLTEKDSEALQRHKPIHIQEMVRFPDGRVVHLETIKSVYRDSNGSIAGIIGIARDVGERRLLHEELKAIRRQLSHIARSRSDLMTRIGSEIRGPLNAINGLTHLMLRTPLDSDQQHYLKKIRGATRTLLATTGDILDYSRLENRKLTLESQPFSLEQVLDNLRDLLHGEADQKGISLELLIAPDAPRHLRGDPGRLGQILYNLTNNGIKFTNRGGVRVSVTPDELGENRVRLKFAIKDSGAGIPPEQREALFDNPGKDRYSAGEHIQGGGFGLAICQRLTELMGGRIQVASEPGIGSTFSFTAVFNRAHPEELEAGTIAIDLTGKRVLLVDGDQNSRKYLWNQLTGLGMEVSPAASVRRGLERLEELRQAGQKADLLLIDWRLPDGNGLDAVQQLRRDDLASTPCLLMTTAYGRSELASPARDAGIDGFLVKPVDERQLRQLLSQALQPRRKDTPSRILIGEQAPAANHLSGGKVLLAEDDLINREVARELLHEAGVQVTTVQSGREAIDQLEHDTFDLVLMDIQMPELDGLAATRMIRLDERFRDLPIIAMTVHARDEDREQCLEAGMNDHVVKPFDPEELYAVLDHWLNPEREAQAIAPHPAAPQEHAEEGRLPQLPGIDLDLALKLTGGSIEVLLRMLRLFRRNYTQVPAKMREDLKAGRLLGVFRSAHSLKSAARYIGATHLARLSESVEQAARDGNTQQAQNALNTFERDFLSLLDAIDVLDGAPGDAEITNNSL